MFNDEQIEEYREYGRQRDKKTGKVIYEAGHITDKYEPFEGLPTGSLWLDWAFGGGKGLPRGQFTMLTGWEGSGKTSIATLIGAKTVDSKLKVAVANVEYRWDVARAYEAGMGMPGRDYVLFSADTMEDTLNYMNFFAEKQHFDLFILDSVAALAPRTEAEGDMDDNTMMLQARKWSQYFRSQAGAVFRSKMAVLMTNQFRTTPVQYGNPNTRTGGNALKFFTSVGVDLERIGADDQLYANNEDKKGKVNPVGAIIVGKTWKNSVAPNFRRFELPVLFSPGLCVDRFAELVDFGKLYGALTAKDGGPIGSGAYHYFKGEMIGESYSKAIEAISKDSVLAEEIETMIRTRLNG